MIEFNGYISGAAEKKFIQKARKFTLIVFIVSILLFLPIVLSIAIKTKYWSILGGYVFFGLIIILAIYSPLISKECIKNKPKRIFIKDGYIVSVTDKEVVYKPISDVDVVHNFDEFYELAFPIGNISEKFICQKSLIAKGSLEEFEALFENKIVNHCNTPIR